jgi:hypothetical protein
MVHFLNNILKGKNGSHTSGRKVLAYTKKRTVGEIIMFIDDEQLFKAVSFASMMIKKGTPKGLAIYKSANYYRVNEHDVASELGKRGACVSKNRRRGK